MISSAQELSGRCAIVTGGARGIGAATARVLAEMGADILIADLIDTTDTVHQVKALGRKAVAVETNVSVPADAQRMADQAIESFGRIDILVNNAGVIHRDRLMETSEATWDRVLNIGVKGTFLCIQAVYPHMRERGYGKIVNVSSISGIIGGAVSKYDDPPEAISGQTGPAYAAANGGVIALTRWVAKDVAKDGIYVNSIAPGACETEMTEGFDYNISGLPIPRMGKPEEMAAVIAFLASDASSYITGQVLNVDGGWVIA
jgi:3-oxoacyl-[acyl-carrier protein] reductase